MKISKRIHYLVASRFFHRKLPYIKGRNRLRRSAAAKPEGGCICNDSRKRLQCHRPLVRKTRRRKQCSGDTFYSYWSRRSARHLASKHRLGTSLHRVSKAVGWWLPAVTSCSWVGAVGNRRARSRNGAESRASGHWPGEHSLLGEDIENAYQSRCFLSARDGRAGSLPEGAYASL
jgi:hypothetical protein